MTRIDIDDDNFTDRLGSIANLLQRIAADCYDGRIQSDYKTLNDETLATVTKIETECHGA